MPSIFSWEFKTNKNQQQIAVNHSSDIQLDFLNPYKKIDWKTLFFWLSDTNFTLGNTLHFRSNPLERISKLIITNDEKFRDVKPQYDIKKEAAKLSSLSSDEIDKYEYLTSKDILPSNQNEEWKNKLGLIFFRKSFKKTNKERNWCFKVFKLL